MARAKENDFTESIKRKLRDRVANLCSNPECKKNTIAANLETADKTTLIGEAAHIKAASSGVGGARFDNSMTYEERRSIDNGIWLCKNCHKMIDREPQKYSVEILRHWKIETESYVREKLGKNHETYIDSDSTNLTDEWGLVAQPRINPIAAINPAIRPQPLLAYQALPID